MRFNRNGKILEEAVGVRSGRIVKQFLWLPLTLNNETRWLEFAHIEQKYAGYSDNRLGIVKPGWYDVGWENE